MRNYLKEKKFRIEHQFRKYENNQFYRKQWYECKWFISWRSIEIKEKSNDDVLEIKWTLNLIKCSELNNLNPFCIIED